MDLSRTDRANPFSRASRDPVVYGLDGLKVEALAIGLEHPRSLYVLPNGDVLVVESKAPPAAPLSRPKDLVMKWIESPTPVAQPVRLSPPVVPRRERPVRTRHVFVDSSPFWLPPSRNCIEHHLSLTQPAACYPCWS
jgi:glucose/arabinose dehydrogenase